MNGILSQAREAFQEDQRCVADTRDVQPARCFRNAYYFIDSGHGFDGRLYCKQHAKQRRYVAGGTIRSL